MTIDYKATLARGLAATSQARPIGACRVYVTFSDEHAKGVGAAAKALGKIFQKKAHYGFRNALYVGYDNFEGTVIARANAIEAEFVKQGVSACVEYAGD